VERFNLVPAASTSERPIDGFKGFGDFSAWPLSRWDGYSFIYGVCGHANILAFIVNSIEDRLSFLVLMRGVRGLIKGSGLFVFSNQQNN